MGALHRFDSDGWIQLEFDYNGLNHVVRRPNDTQCTPEMYLKTGSPSIRERVT